MLQRRIFTTSLPTAVLAELDKRRGDIPRSKYLLRIVQKALDLQMTQSNEVKSKKGTESSSFQH